MSQSQQYRIERDSMGEFEVPMDAYYGANTMRAVLNFPISDLRFSRSFIKAIASIKLAAAQTNRELGLLDDDTADAIVTAAREVADGGFDQQFVVDIFQTGSGTSTNMNANEVISNRAIENLGGVKGSQWFSTISQAQTVIGKWLRQYNHVRPHQALNMRPPVPETLLASGP